MTMDDYQNNEDLLREKLKAAVLELTPDEQKELVKMIRQLKAERAQEHTAASRSQEVFQ